MKDYFTSTYNMIDLNPVVALPAHGPPSFAPKVLLQNYIEHRLKRENMILECVLKGINEPVDIVKVVYKDVSTEMWPAAVRNIELHLKKLKEEGKINVAKM